METETAAGGFAIHPMDQFIVRPLFSDGPVQWYTVTNVTLWLALAVLCVAALMIFGTRRRALVPSRSQSMAEMAYGLVHNMVEEVTGPEGVKYFPYVMTLFMFILFANLLGLIPASFTTTSHVAVTVTLALMVFVGVTVLGFVRKGPGFLKMFWVESAPLPVRPVLAIIELISYFVRPVSHSIRLAGNLMAGHAVIKVFAGFATMAILSPVAIGAVTVIYGLETLVAVVQAYVFTILTCVYLRDAVADNHH
ncbi:F0F1 ATP synthase subunit A [Falsirhodobacter sp. 20TX0035]|uniref:F0F1 ATP synthase subunit A n=1 Tax=Falsirhodobacter sp. 20TX0035 TaxID=3022019 RepID=UPI00232E5C24|nr:F0F1 ATP synthase subunit A [Falsirhodobacter sp. 20TX0035]MDB6452259.1 F0F1 ATP synthase subunit A [Falsirhodobacter sp. 20TX0035]